MNMLKNLWRWHPKVALRYLPIIKKIHEEGLSKNSILEIGSGSLGIAPYLGKSLVGVDLDFSGPQTDLLTKVRGSVLQLPFEDKSFDTVIMVDVLEHILNKYRETAVSEAIRVCRKLFIVATPEGIESEKEDRYLSAYYKKTFGKEFPFFNEHIDYGLPKKEELNATINKIGKNKGRKLKIEIRGNINMNLHRFLMKGWMTNNKLVDIIFRKVFLLFIPIFLKLNKEPVYRKIFYVTFIK